ncbi:MAG: tRNA guanosine(34) transglycosylase Tgt [Planctomycetota bacterium]|nr:tRNA guanosine(34) transglycosylase Tgt [Planctomycetota bacterium]
MDSTFSFRVDKTDGRARTGVLRTAHGQVATPVFMPCGTYGAIKGVTPDQLRDAGVQMVLANAYHLMLRPGAEAVSEMGGLHKMMAWDGPILTDSGGYQVFSLASMRKVSDEGVVFQSHIDGDTVELTPERCMDVQSKLGANIIMQLDECPPADAPKDRVAQAVVRSAEWARRCKSAWEQGGRTGGQALFGIQQGGIFTDLRRRSAEALVDLDLPGYAVGGLSVGEGHEKMKSVLEHIDEQFPAEKPRYLMGVGEPRDIIAAVACGIDMFDCVLPTRNGRNAQAFTWSGRIKLRNAVFAADKRPLEEQCTCYTCRNFSRAALRHYFQAGEMLAATLVTIHNLTFFSQLTSLIRQAVADGELAVLSGRWIERMYPSNGIDA